MASLCTDTELYKQIENLLTGFEFDGKILKHDSVEIAEANQLNEIYLRYKNEMPNFEANDLNIEELLPFIQEFNEKRFWMIEDNSKVRLKEGQLLVSQNGQTIVINAGNYLNGGFFKEEDDNVENRGLLDPDTKIIRRFVYIYRTKKVERAVKNFYVNVEGDYALKIVEKPIIRFYFNLLPDKEGAKIWSDYLQYEFNKWRIPFQLKYPLNLKNYNYSDSGVLYISQNHFPLVVYVLNNFMSRLYSMGIVGDSIPLFTKQLYKGVAFAEDPLNTSENESYGMHRCNLIWTFIKNNKLTLDENNRETTIEKTTEHLMESGYNKGFYRNANTEYKYNFEANFESKFTNSYDYSTKLNFINEIRDKLESRVEKVDNFLEMYDKFKDSYKKDIQSLNNILRQFNTNFDEFNSFTKEYGRLKYLKLAENYAKDLIEKAIWNPDKKEYDWLTYDQRDKKNSKTGFYRLVLVEEKEQINLFLTLLIVNKRIEKDYYQLARDRLGLSPIPDSELMDIPIKFINLWSLLDNEHSDLVENISKIQDEVNAMGSITKLMDGARNLAPKVNDYFEKLSLPTKNDFGNYEYCPTFQGKLKIALLYVFASDPLSYESLKKAYIKWASDNALNLQREKKEVLERFLHLPFVASTR